MKNFRSIILITTILLVGLVINLSAQSRPENTSSAKAAYGVHSEPGKLKTKKKHKTHKNKQAKAVKEKSPAYRRRGNWVI